MYIHTQAHKDMHICKQIDISVCTFADIHTSIYRTHMHIYLAAVVVRQPNRTTILEKKKEKQDEKTEKKRIKERNDGKIKKRKKVNKLKKKHNKQK